MPFEPQFTITPKTAQALMHIEGARQSIHHLPITPSVLATLRAAYDWTSQRTTRNLLRGWAEAGFLLVADHAKKSRKYGLSSEFRLLVK
jgi:hypothetical protein